MKYHQRRQAFHLYLEDDLTVTEIAARIGISRRSIQLWAKNENWDALRDNIETLNSTLSNASTRLIADYTDHLVARGAQAPVTTLEVNALYHAVSAVSKLNQHLAAGNCTPAKKVRKNMSLID